MSFLLYGLGRILILPFTLGIRLVAWLLTTLIRLSTTAVILTAEFAVGALAVIIPLALIIAVIFGLVYMVSMVRDGLW